MRAKKGLTGGKRVKSEVKKKIKQCFRWKITDLISQPSHFEDGARLLVGDEAQVLPLRMFEAATKRTWFKGFTERKGATKKKS